jgi:hypothetical protein
LKFYTATIEFNGSDFEVNPGKEGKLVIERAKKNNDSGQ